MKILMTEHDIEIELTALAKRRLELEKLFVVVRLAKTLLGKSRAETLHDLATRELVIHRPTAEFLTFEVGEELACEALDCLEREDEQAPESFEQ
jgi:hypothetical protein